MSEDRLNQSGLVTGGQQGTHPRLDECIQRHLNRPWTQPLHRPSLGAYRHFRETCGLSQDTPFILDSGCGTGASTRMLGAQYPDQLVIGIDRSRERLARSGAAKGLVQSGNCVLIRAELATFWRLLAEDGFAPTRHYLLYPNPWPKAHHLKRRWHGHPVFPCLLSLGGLIEMRCNWEVYALEFARAVQVASGYMARAERYRPEKPISPFEHKYLERGQHLYRVTVPPACNAGLR